MPRLMSLALGPVSKLMTGTLYALLNSRHSWFDSLHITAAAEEELQFWHKKIDEYNVQNI